MYLVVSVYVVLWYPPPAGDKARVGPRPRPPCWRGGGWGPTDLDSRDTAARRTQEEMTHSPAPRPALHLSTNLREVSRNAKKRPLLGTLLKVLAAAFTIKNLLSYTFSRLEIGTLVSKDRN